MLTLIVALALSAQAANEVQTEFTVDRYWELSKARLELSTAEWRERVVSAEQARGDKPWLIARSAAITKQYADYQTELAMRFGITQQGFIRFGSTHAREIDSYLAEQPATKQTIDDLRKTLQALMERFDALTQPGSGGGVAR